MQFYRLKFKRQKEGKTNDSTQTKDLAYLSSRSLEFNNENKDKTAVFIESFKEDSLTVCSAFKDNYEPEIADHFVEFCKLNASFYRSAEISYKDFLKTLRTAISNGYYSKRGSIVDNLGLSPALELSDFTEKIVCKASDSRLYEMSRDIYAGNDLSDELTRIFRTETDSIFLGHPVHYILETETQSKSLEMAEVLCSALYSRNRLKCRRLTVAEITPESIAYSSETLEDYFKLSEGGTLLLNYYEGESLSQYETIGDIIFKLLCENIFKYRNSVLVIFNIPKNAKRLKERIIHELENICCVEIREGLIHDDDCRRYLNKLAKENKISPEDSLYQDVNEGQLFTFSDLDNIFGKWFDGKIRNLYSQYDSFYIPSYTRPASKPEGDAYTELESMIGQESAKTIVKEIIDYHNYRKLLKNNGLPDSSICTNMVFAGNPGTAKTSMARLFARILADNGVITNSKLIEVGRADIIGKYVGHTAGLVREAFDMAKNSVLLIDEAYSLLDDRDYSFGDEAINAIVQEMENRRDEVIVIFAGYPDRMEEFLDRNPGLQSRIAFHVDFDDYSPKELSDIAVLQAAERGFYIDPHAIDKLIAIFSAASKDRNFGNGRFARNLVEHAILRHASSYKTQDKIVQKDDLITLSSNDFEYEYLHAKRKNEIGFKFL